MTTLELREAIAAALIAAQGVETKATTLDEAAYEIADVILPVVEAFVAEAKTDVWERAAAAGKALAHEEQTEQRMLRGEW